jgi:peptidoglycan/LPS O-acetylase OafA/YrhL
MLGPQRNLDGLRGVAIVAVLATHMIFLDSGSPTWSLRGGFLGVDLFLGLSAFLISAVLLREIDTRQRAKASLPTTRGHSPAGGSDACTRP